jgi:hypothetical protein
MALILNGQNRLYGGPTVPLHPFLVRHILYGTSGLPTGKLYYTKNPSENP